MQTKLQPGSYIFFSVLLQFLFFAPYPQAHILITSSLVRWKCEPRKSDSAKTVCPLIVSQAEPLVGRSTESPGGPQHHSNVTVFTQEIRKIRR